MSTEYGAQDRVPTEILIARLEELSRAVTEGKESVARELCRLRELMTPNADVTGLPPAQTVEIPPKSAGGRSELVIVGLDARKELR